MRGRSAGSALGVWLFGASIGLLAQSLPLDPPDPPALRPGRAADLRLETTARNFRLWSGIPIESGPPFTNGPGVQIHARTRIMTPGRFVFRLANTNGLSPWRIGLVDPLPARAAAGLKGTAPEVHPPIAIDGAVPAAGVRRFTVALRKNQPLTIEAVARRFGSPLDPRLRVLDAAGKELAAADDVAGLERDTWIRFIAPASGDYIIEISDSLGDGGPRHRFRLRLHRGVPELFPFLNVEGVGAPAKEALRLVSVPFPSDQPLPAPCTVKAVFAKPGEPLRYRFHTGTNGNWRVDLRTRSLASRADVVARFETADGKLLAEGDATKGEDGSLSQLFREAGDPRLVLTELSRGAGPGYDVEFDLVPTQPDFRVALDRESLELTPGGTTEVKATITRRGYDGVVELAAPGLPEGYRLEGTTIAAKKNDAVMKILAPTNAVPGTLWMFRMTASADVAGRRFTNAVLTRAALKAAWPDLLCPPPGLDGVLTIGVKEK